MGHVLIYTRENSTSAGGDKPAWNDTTTVNKPRPLSHQLAETDKAKTPVRERLTYIESFESVPPPAKDWNSATAVDRKPKAQREKEKEDEKTRIQRTQQWYETNRSQFPTRESKPSEPQEKVSPKPVLKGKLKPKDTKVKKYSHDGVWEISSLEGKHVWSCCLNTQKDSQGCKCTVTDPSKRNFASIN